MNEREMFDWRLQSHYLESIGWQGNIKDTKKDLDPIDYIAVKAKVD